MTLATLAGQPIAAAGPVTWGLRTGSRPYTSEFSFAGRQAKNIEKAKRGFTPLTLQIGTRTYQNIFVAKRVPSAHPDLWRYLCADLRILWTKVWIGPKGYNHIKKSGNVRWVGGDLQRFSPTSALAQYIYEQWSLNGSPGQLGPKPLHTAFSVLADVIEQLQKATAYRLPWRTEGTTVWNKRQTPVIDLTIDDRGDAAIARALRYAGGVDLYVTERGTVKATDRLDGSEGAVIRSGPPPINGGSGSIPTVVSREDDAPQRIDVIFELEAEVRFNFVDGGGLSGSPPPGFGLQNVMRVIMQEIDANDGSGVTWAYGTIITIDQGLQALTGLTLPPTAAGPLTQAVIRRGIASGLLASEYTGAVGGVTSAIPDWQLMLGEILSSWRQRFRLPREWLERSKGWRVTRGSVLDPQYSERANALVFTDYAIRWAQDRFTLGAAAADGATHENISGWASLIAASKPVPAELAIDGDPALGVFSVRLTGNRWKKYGDIYPFQFENLPDRRFHRNNGSSVFLDEHLTATTEHKLSVILTLTPAPTGHSRYVVSINPSQVSSRLGPGVKLGNPVGPVKEVRVTTRKAIVGWRDQAQSVTSALFGFSSSPPSKADIDKLLINGDEIQDLAIAEATREYARYAERIEGDYTVAGTPDISPTGRIEGVFSTVDTEGVTTSSIILPGDPPELDARAFLTEDARRNLGYELRPDR